MFWALRLFWNRRKNLPAETRFWPSKITRYPTGRALCGLECSKSNAFASHSPPLEQTSETVCCQFLSQNQGSPATCGNRYRLNQSQASKALRGIQAKGNLRSRYNIFNCFQSHAE